MAYDPQPATTEPITDGSASNGWRETVAKAMPRTDCFMIDPSTGVLDEMVGVLTERLDTDAPPAPNSDSNSDANDRPPHVRLVVAESVRKALTSEFTGASELAELTERDVLSLRTSPDRLGGAVVVSADRVVSLVRADGFLGAAPLDNDAFVAAANDHYTTLWEAAEAVALRTPARSRVRASLEAEFGDEVLATFDDLFRVVAEREQGPARRHRRAQNGGTENENENRRPAPLDGVTMCLLAGAAHGEMLYDLSTVGEEVGVASRATFSRMKNRLEDAGLLTTEKVPIEVGRPRQRLLLGERGRGLDATALVTRAEEALASG